MSPLAGTYPCQGRLIQWTTASPNRPKDSHRPESPPKQVQVAVDLPPQQRSLHLQSEEPLYRLDGEGPDRSRAMSLVKVQNPSHQLNQERPDPHLHKESPAPPNGCPSHPGNDPHHLGNGQVHPGNGQVHPGNGQVHLGNNQDHQGNDRFHLGSDHNHRENDQDHPGKDLTLQESVQFHQESVQFHQENDQNHQEENPDLH